MAVDSLARSGAIKKAPKLFGKQGFLSPWIMAFAGSAMLYFRCMHLEQPPTIYLIVLIKATPIFILFALTLELTQHGASARYAKAVGRGLLCSAAGDIFLDFEGAFKHDGLFIGGLLSFLVAHLFYLVAFGIGMKFADIRQDVAAPLALYGLSLFAYLIVYVPSTLVLPVFVYASVIASMAITAICRPLPAAPTGAAAPAGGAASSGLAATWSLYSGSVGALIFVVSDSVLAVNKFAFAVPSGKDILMATYYAGQLGIALSCWGAWEPTPPAEPSAAQKEAKKTK